MFKKLPILAPSKENKGKKLKNGFDQLVFFGVIIVMMLPVLKYLEQS